MLQRPNVGAVYAPLRRIPGLRFSEAQAMDNHDLSRQHESWQEEQERLKTLLVLYDDFTSEACSSRSNHKTSFRLVGGVDISFHKEDPELACGAIVVMDMDTMSLVYEDFEIARLDLPYLPGFLAFRESPILLKLIRKLSRQHPELFPDVLMLDGNGILHPRGFGLACHVGVLANIPTIGVAKNLYHVDGLSRELLKTNMTTDEVNRTTPLIGDSGHILGMALRSHPSSTKPIFVSIGHRISLQTAVELVQKCCKHRIPEPVRQADIRSREKLRALV